jgi:hypothetical protein
MSEPGKNTEASPFLRANAELLRAKAAQAEMLLEPACEDGSDDDRKISAAMDIVTAAEWKLMQTPAVGLAEIRQRAHIVLEMFSEEIEQGEPTDNRHRLMLATLVTEIRSPIPE